MKRILFVLVFVLALFARAATQLAAEPIDTTGIPSNALMVFHADILKTIEVFRRPPAEKP